MFLTYAIDFIYGYVLLEKTFNERMNPSEDNSSFAKETFFQSTGDYVQLGTQ